jgi:anti-sigma B factor antagonist
MEEPRMEVSTQQFKHCDLVAANGRIDSYTAPRLDGVFKDIQDARRYKFVFDMSKVDYMSSAGMRVLMSVQKNCKRYNRGELVLCGVSPRIYEALELAGFAPLFKFFDDPIIAVGYF